MFSFDKLSWLAPNLSLGGAVKSNTHAGEFRDVMKTTVSNRLCVLHDATIISYFCIA